MIYSPLLLSLVAVGCLPLGNVAPADCRSPRETLSLEASAADMGGRYSLVFVATEGDHKGKVARGRMELLRRDSTTAIRLDGNGRPHPNLREPYYGSAEINLEALGAYTSGSLASRDPTRPGIVVFEWRSKREEVPTAIQLMIGADKTRRDIISVDGPFVDIQVREFLPEGFRGTWEASVGYSDYRSSGFFCANREA